MSEPSSPVSVSPDPVITIDGPSGTGKGTLSRLLAQKLGWHMLDSGALYRVLAVGAEQAGLELVDSAELTRFARNLDVEFSSEDSDVVLLAGKDIGQEIRLEQSGEKASQVAAIPAVRAALLDRQYGFRCPPGLVADGRDMGTVVFPDAILKIYLTASPEERAKRRHKQLINKGVYGSLPALLEDIQARDQRDMTRSVSPLKPAKDAIIIDTSDFGIEQVLETVLSYVETAE